jgi:predicted  nucleic acid-binding Zn-ribbon protein
MPRRRPDRPDRAKRALQNEISSLRHQLTKLRKQVRAARVDREANRLLAEANLRRCAELQADVDRQRKRLDEGLYAARGADSRLLFCK